jgi:hypothetical protein
MNSSPINMNPCWNGEVVMTNLQNGEEHKVAVSGTDLSIVPTQGVAWSVESELDINTCSSVVNFNVPGKASPPAMNLTVIFFRATALAGPEEYMNMRFTDADGTLVYEWVQTRQ